MQHLDVVILASGANGLGAIRSLAKNGLKVGVIAESPDDVSLLSRYPVWKASLPAGDMSAAATMSALSAAKGTNAVIIPTSDRMVSVLSNHQEELSDHFRLCVAPREAVELCIDKAEEVVRVADVIPLPESVVKLPATAEELLQELQLPIIVKPRSHKHYVIGAKNIILHTTQDVIDFYTKFATVRESVIAQEIISGPDSNQLVCNCVFDAHSKIVSAFTFRRLGLSPAHRGVTSYAVSEVNEEVVELSAKLGASLNFTGPAMIEFKRCERDGLYKYIELNPRLGLCNSYDAKCGVPNALNAYKCCIGEPAQHVIHGESGVYFVNFFEDAYARLKDGESLRAVFSRYLGNVFKKHAFLYFDLSDPRPALHVELGHVKTLGASLFGKAARLLRIQT